MLKAIYGHEFESVVMDYVLELELQLAEIHDALEKLVQIKESVDSDTP